MTLLIHQPEFLQYIGFWNRLSKADVFVALDTATYQKHGFMKRNKIKTAKGWQWFGVPLQHESSFTQIKDLLIDNSKPWREQQLALLEQNYRKAPYFSQYFPWFKEVISQPRERMIDLIMKFLQDASSFLEIKAKIIRASELKAQSKATELLVNICKELGADTYLAGPGQREGREGYMEPEKFEQAGIKLQINGFAHPEYKQQFMEQGFLPYMSVIDLFFNEGENSKNIIRL